MDSDGLIFEFSECTGVQGSLSKLHSHCRGHMFDPCIAHQTKIKDPAEMPGPFFLVVLK